MNILRRTVIFGLLAVQVGAAPALAQNIPESQLLIKAIRSGDGVTAMGLISANPTLVNARGYAGETPIMVAIEEGEEDWAGYFITKGADVALTNNAGETPLTLATRKGLDQVVGWLIEKKAPINQANKSGETPLILAVQVRNARIAQRLLAAGADPDKSDYTGHSARDYAKREDRDPKIQQLFAAPKPAN